MLRVFKERRAPSLFWQLWRAIHPEGFLENIMNFLNALNVDHLVLEFARRGYDELEAFKGLRETSLLALG